MKFLRLRFYSFQGNALLSDIVKIGKLEPRQYKNDSIQSKIIPTLKLPRFFTTYTVRGKERQFQNWNHF